eukprot:TRINITY_DN10924_c0_g1_i1.p1 TRINITY_DN10924_c0_g1~~TRINITY_DN10924_c0_g1_i1.p1  ORF type:complete len:172 (+),score=27.38 TRINITY_DN10924_c0_g1_i1:25-516(+)
MSDENPIKELQQGYTMQMKALEKLYDNIINAQPSVLVAEIKKLGDAMEQRDERMQKQIAERDERVQKEIAERDKELRNELISINTTLLAIGESQVALAENLNTLLIWTKTTELDSQKREIKAQKTRKRQFSEVDALTPVNIKKLKQKLKNLKEKEQRNASDSE